MYISIPNEALNQPKLVSDGLVINYRIFSNSPINKVNTVLHAETAG